MLLHISVVPNAKHERREQQVDLLGNTIHKVWLTVPPVDGKANEALIAFLSKQFSTPKSWIHIVKGMSSRQKTVEIKQSN